jgi:glycosyltransferase involved in cell wall biosynthesis
MLTKGLGRGGAERLIVGAARLIDRERFDLDVAYLLPWKDAFVADVEATGTPVHCLDGPRVTSLGWLGRLRALVRERDIDVVHTHMPLPAAAARLALPGRRPAFVHTEHNLWDRYRPPTRAANAVTYRRNARAIAVSDGVAASIRSRVPVDVVVHGVDRSLVATAPDARDRARALLGLPVDVQVIGTVGNFTAKKDQATLLRALAQPDLAGGGAASGDGGPHLVLVGLGPLEAGLRTLARDLGLAGRVHFAGSRDDVFDVLPAFDVFTLSSKFEGLPIALLEAMATGVAPVVTAVGGIPEVVHDGEDGLLVPPGAPGPLATAIARLLAAPEVRHEIAGRARARAADFDLAHAVRRTESIYLGVLGPRPRSLTSAVR